jgi:hypothetical protein
MMALGLKDNKGLYQTQTIDQYVDYYDTYN